MSKIYIALGSNLEEPSKQIYRAINLIDAIDEISVRLEITQAHQYQMQAFVLPNQQGPDLYWIDFVQPYL